MIRRIELSPVGRIENLSNLLRGSAGDNELSIPCGNFSRQYACMCDYYGLPYREEVAWVKFSLTVLRLKLNNTMLICDDSQHEIGFFHEFVFIPKKLSYISVLSFNNLLS